MGDAAAARQVDAVAAPQVVDAAVGAEAAPEAAAAKRILDFSSLTRVARLQEL